MESVASFYLQKQKDKPSKERNTPAIVKRTKIEAKKMHWSTSGKAITVIPNPKRKERGINRTEWSSFSLDNMKFLIEGEGFYSKKSRLWMK